MSELSLPATRFEAEEVGIPLSEGNISTALIRTERHTLTTFEQFAAKSSDWTLQAHGFP